MSALLDQPRDQMLGRITSNPNLPAPPGIALQVLEKASEPDCSLVELEQIIALDPGLCGQLLKTVNSALYGMHRPVSSIRQTLNLLGTTSVRSLVLSLSLPALQRGPIEPALLRLFWKTSVAGAVIAREVAVRMKWPGTEDALVAGLLRDLGSLVLPQVMPEETQRLTDVWTGEELGGPPLEIEEEVYGLSHAEVGAYLLRQWRLPPEITEPVRYHHRPEQAPPQHALRARMLHFATQTALLQLGPPDPSLRELVHEEAATHFDMDEAALIAFLDPLAHKMAELASLVKVYPGPWQHFPAVLAAAAELGKLTMANTAHQVLLREQRDQAEHDAGHWREKAAQLHDEAVRDPLTGCFNRRYFEESLHHSFRRARTRCLPMGLLFIDLNGFKQLNDRQGHAFGDQVLKAVAARLMASARTGDVVARFGGDEFCVIPQGITEGGLQTMGERLRNAIASLQLRGGVGAVNIRGAVGGALCLPYRDGATPADLVAAADAAMYDAKRKSQSGVCFVVLADEQDRQCLSEIENRLFSNFLVASGRISAEELAANPRSAATPPLSLARLARVNGWLTREQAFDLLLEQRATKRSFAELVEARNILTRSQLISLFALQREAPTTVASMLVNRCLLSADDVTDALNDYMKDLRKVDLANKSCVTR